MCLRETLGLICLFLAVVALSTTITINFRLLYLFDIQHLNILKDIEVDHVTLIRNHDHLIIYLNNPSEKTLIFPDSPMSDSTASHFYEVEELSLLCYGVLLVTLLPSVLYLKHPVKNQRLQTLIRSFQRGMFLLVLFSPFVLIGFDQFSIAFHGSFLDNDAWLLNPLTDPIINALPGACFVYCFILFLVLLEDLFLVGILIEKRFLKK